MSERVRSADSATSSASISAGNDTVSVGGANDAVTLTGDNDTVTFGLSNAALSLTAEHEGPLCGLVDYLVDREKGEVNPWVRDYWPVPAQRGADRHPRAGLL